MAGFVADQAAAWGGSTVTIRALPSMAIRSAWAIGPKPGSMSSADADRNWRELGDGSYLMTVERNGQRVHAVVDVGNGIVIDREPIDEDQISALPGLYSLLEEGPTTAPAPVVPIAIADRPDVPVQ